LFSKYDCGIKIDTEGWYSVTPEIIANYLAKRINELNRGGETKLTVLDPFVGVGGNLI
jgi:trimethylguanosine synthase